MECLTPSREEAIPTKVEGAGKVQHWVRAALLGTLPFLCGGGDSPPLHHRYEEEGAAQHSSLEGISTPRRDGLPGTFYEEQVKNPGLTEEQYLDLLARTLTTPEKLDQFLGTRMRYVWDSPDSDNPLQEGTEDNHGNYWQTPHETVRRVEKGQMLGDCEDYALLIEALLLLQMKNAHVVLLPKEGHAMCAWVEKDAEGKYQGYGADTTGVITGNKRETLTEAVQDATLHYPFHPYWIPVGRRAGPWWYADVVSIHAFDPDLPCITRISGLELAALTALLGGSYATYRFLRRRREEARETWKEYFTTYRLH